MEDQQTTNTNISSSNNNNNNSNTRRSNFARGRGGRGNNNRRGNQSNRDNRSGFKGECEELKNHTYFIGNLKQADNFNNTTEAILAYIQRTYDYGSDVMEALENLEPKDFMSLMPRKPDLGSQIWFPWH